MFSKPFNLILVYILCIVNLLIIFLPFILIASPFLVINKSGFYQFLTDTIYLNFFIVSFIMLCYLLLDTIFGFTIWSLTKASKNIKKYHKKYPYTKEISENFITLQDNFATQNIKLLISKSSEINAYAIGSVRKKIVVITLGLIAHIRKNVRSEEEFQNVIKCIMAHEISHLINKDFLPALLLFANQKATNFISYFVNLFFNIIIRIFYLIPILGSFITNIIIVVHNITRFIISFFHRYILIKIYNFLKLHISRKNEYRCDFQAALACDGKNMANALSYLGNNGYFTIFSSHPNTLKRIKKVENVKQAKGKIKVSFINKISNFSSILLLIILLDVSWNYVSKLEYLKIKNNHIINNMLYKQKYYLNLLKNKINNY
jgi:Zn-dependent protease with chaperone function